MTNVKVYVLEGLMLLLYLFRFVKMASIRVLLVLVVTFAALAAVCDAFAFCRFPDCCATGDCGPICPSCREAREFRNGFRIRRKPTRFGGPCSSGGLIVPDPFLFPQADVFPSPLLCV